MILIFFIFILIYIIKFWLKKTTLEGIKYKIDDSYKNNYKISLSLIPVFNSNYDNYLEFYNMIDYIDKSEPNDNMYEKSKISIKIRQFGRTSAGRLYNIEKLLSYAKKRKIFVWIATVFTSDLEDEYNTFLYFKKRGYDNLGLTLSTQNKEVSEKVDNLLKMKCNIRLVKGYYNGDIKHWNVVSNIYLINAVKLVKSNIYHCIATHDFKIINELKCYNNNPNIEYAFFYQSKKYVFHNLLLYNLSLKHKSFYIHYGDPIYYLRDNFFHVDKYNICIRFLNSLSYY
tara:strand:+ start:1084 stop:1938 length:855 start_codon:yes stop_codon:yes gene_type:complete